MRGAMYNGIRNVTLAEVPAPVINEEEVLVKVIRSGICGTDIHAYTEEGETVGILPGHIFGHEMVGQVCEVGAKVEGIEVGTRVFINPCTFRNIPEGWSATMSADMGGAFSEYVRVQNPEIGYNLFPLADNVSFDEAALCEPLSVSMHGVNLSGAKPGDKAVIYGAGTIGLAALVGLRSKGVTDIIVSDIVPSRLEVVKRMGGIPHDAREGKVMDYAKEVWGTTVDNFGGEANNVDVVFDCAGFKGVFAEYMATGKYGSKFVSIALGNKADDFVPTIAVLREVRIIGSCGYVAKDNQEVVDLLAKKEIDVTPMITAKYPLSQVSEAFEDACNKDKNIKVIIDIEK